MAPAPLSSNPASPVPSVASIAPAHTVVYTSRHSTRDNGGQSFGELYHNYFVFVAIAIAIALLVACAFYRRKKRIIHQANLSRQIALTRDIQDQGIRANRGWGWGALSRDYASGPTPHGQPLAVRGATARRREEEGLNDAGEAPPAYKAAPGYNDTVLETARPASTTNLATPTFPRPALARENTGLKPPDYTETAFSPISPGRGSSNTTVPTFTATNTHTNAGSEHLPTYNDTHDRR
ncbi:unnamed protein product [Aureobasidium mustum]|uniref:Uncharacterized protein n=1 Tax=Aureobasidium mustum TaxID=2773714 RepID=A0A9N8JL46_9PEZI|nr:unnamed protein product [Aureobasidium mustum]